MGCDRKPRVKTRRVYLDYPEGPGGGDVPPGGWWRPEGPSKAFSASMGTALEDCFALGGGDRGSKKGSTSNPRAGTVGEWAPSRKRSLVRELCGDRQGRGSTCFNRTSTLECLSDHICVKKTHLPFERP